MSPRGYSNKYLVADALGTHDGVVPVQMVDTLIEAAENWITRRTGRTWLQTTITGEVHSHTSSTGIVQLKSYPVTAVSAVRARPAYVGALNVTLLTSQYELLDPALGQLLLTRWLCGYRLSIDYTSSAPVPADITLATTLLTVSWARPMILPDEPTATDPISLRAQGIKSYSIGQDLSVTFQDAETSQDTTLSAPIEVQRLVDQYRPMSLA
jgi:hypothetical protein